MEVAKRLDALRTSRGLVYNLDPNQENSPSGSLSDNDDDSSESDNEAVAEHNNDVVPVEPSEKTQSQSGHEANDGKRKRRNDDEKLDEVVIKFSHISLDTEESANKDSRTSDLADKPSSMITVVRPSQCQDKFSGGGHGNQGAVDSRPLRPAESPERKVVTRSAERRKSRSSFDIGVEEGNTQRDKPRGLDDGVRRRRATKRDLFPNYVKPSGEPARFLGSQEFRIRPRKNYQGIWAKVSEELGELWGKSQEGKAVPSLLEREIAAFMSQRGIECVDDWKEYVRTMEQDGETMADICDMLRTDVVHVKGEIAALFRSSARAKKSLLGPKTG
ncbi:hypothetical protein OSTOST_14758 [Ostertagia ostertagi]